VGFTRNQMLSWRLSLSIGLPPLLFLLFSLPLVILPAALSYFLPSFLIPFILQLVLFLSVRKGKYSSKYETRAAANSHFHN